MADSRGAGLLVVDVQVDFCPGGALPVPNGHRLVPVLNRYLDDAVERGLPIYASRDWHPAVTGHFKPYGGEWPPHCIQHTDGARFHPALRLPLSTIVISKGDDPQRPGYSAFEGRTGGTSLLEDLRQRAIQGCTSAASPPTTASGYRCSMRVVPVSRSRSCETPSPGSTSVQAIQIVPSWKWPMPALISRQGPVGRLLLSLPLRERRTHSAQHRDITAFAQASAYRLFQRRPTAHAAPVRVPPPALPGHARSTVAARAASRRGAARAETARTPRTAPPSGLIR